MKFKYILLTMFMFFFSPTLINAYTMEEVAKHNTENDCWATFDTSVYDLTEYITTHDQYLDIRTWCGLDIQADFMSKANTGEDHKRSSYSLLESYKIGSLDEVIAKENVVTTSTTTEEVKDVKEAKEYNLILPLLISIITYWGMYLFVKSGKFGSFNILKFNGIWNSILLLTLLIPALGFGIFMVVRSKKPELWNIDFDFLYWHVELSLVMGILAVNHLIQRFVIYVRQLGFGKK